MMLMGYSHKVFEGFSWHSVFIVSTKVLAAVKMIVLARILEVSDFGLFSLAAIALGITEATTQTGINITLVQSKKDITHFLDTAWIIAIIRGTGIGIFMMCLAVIMKNFYHEPKLLPIITLAAFVPFIKGFINPAIVGMQKNLSFFWDSVYRISLTAVDVTVAIFLALFFKSVFVLIIAMLASAIFEVAISFFFFTDRPKFNYLPDRAKEIFGQAQWLNLSAILSYLQINLDNLMIGKLTATASLGFYYNAYQISHTPNYELAKSVHHSTLPVLSKISDDSIRLRNAFIKSCVVSLLVFTLISAPLFIFPQFTTWIFGSKWQNSVPLIRPLIIAGLVNSLALITYTLWYAQKKYRLLNTHLALNILAMVILIGVATPRWGLVGAAWAVTISRLISLPLIGWGIYQTLLVRKHRV